VFSTPPERRSSALSSEQLARLAERLAAAASVWRDRPDFEERLTELRRIVTSPTSPRWRNYLAVPCRRGCAPVERPDNWQTSAWDRLVKLPARGRRRVVRGALLTSGHPGFARVQCSPLRTDSGQPSALGRRHVHPVGYRAPTSRRRSRMRTPTSSSGSEVGGIPVQRYAPRARALPLHNHRQGVPASAGAARREQVHTLSPTTTTRRSRPSRSRPRGNRSRSAWRAPPGRGSRSARRRECPAIEVGLGALHSPAGADRPRTPTFVR